MRIVFCGTPDFAVLPLKNILDNADEGFEVVAAITNPDRPFGRKMVLTPPPVKVLALERGIKVFQYNKIREEGLNDLKSLAPDLMITCAFGQILSKEILEVPKYGTLNIHASLLPKYRGASPIQCAILNGEKQTGVTIMRTDVGLDTGDILIKESTDIADGETAGELFDRLSEMGARLILDALKLVRDKKAVYTPQGDGASYSYIIKKQDALIDFKGSAADIVNKIRAFNPSPVAYTVLDGEPLKIYRAALGNGVGRAGEVINTDGVLEIAADKGSVIITELKKAGGKLMSAQDFLRGNKLPKGFRF